MMQKLQRNQNEVGVYPPATFLDERPQTNEKSMTSTDCRWDEDALPAFSGEISNMCLC